MNNNSEPTLSQIDDYSGKASPKKQLAVGAIVIGILAIGALFLTVNSLLPSPPVPVVER